MSTLTNDWLPGDTPILVGQYGTAHRVTTGGAACGSRERLRRSIVTAAAGHHIPACTDPKCWQGRQPW